MDESTNVNATKDSATMLEDANRHDNEDEMACQENQSHFNAESSTQTVSTNLYVLANVNTQYICKLYICVMQSVWGRLT